MVCPFKGKIINDNSLNILPIQFPPSEEVLVGLAMEGSGHRVSSQPSNMERAIPSRQYRLLLQTMNKQGTHCLQLI